MRQNSLHKEQFLAFKNYSRKFYGIDNLLVLADVFDRWADSKDFVEEDREIIWGMVEGDFRDRELRYSE